LVARAEEFEAWAEDVRAEERVLRLARERITLCRRDIAKMIATGIDEAVPVGGCLGKNGSGAGQGISSWADIHGLYRAIMGRIPRSGTRQELEPIAEELTLLADEILSLLETHVKDTKMGANESQIERHIHNSNPNNLVALEPASRESQGTKPEPESEPLRSPRRDFPLGMILEACPDIADYAKSGISNWRDFLVVVALVRSVLGISPSAWAAAQSAMGEIPAAIVVAAILQKGKSVTSAGGYLRELTRKAAAGEFTIGPMLMALISARKREKKRA
jgi:replication initiation protein RepC